MIMRILTITLLIFLISCKTGEKFPLPEEEFNLKNIEFTILKEGTNSGYKQLGNVLIYKLSRLDMVWDSLFLNYSRKPPIPVIDFEIKQLVWIGMGEQRSGGYSIKVKSVIERKKELIINIIESKPGKTCMTTSVITQPYQLIEIPKTNKKIIYNRVENIYECKK